MVSFIFDFDCFGFSFLDLLSGSGAKSRFDWSDEGFLKVRMSMFSLATLSLRADFSHYWLNGKNEVKLKPSDYRMLDMEKGNLSLSLKPNIQPNLP